MGAHIIKVKPPTAHLSLEAAKKVYEDQKIDISTMAKRVEHVMQARFAGRRIVVFSGGEAKGLDGALRGNPRPARRRRQRLASSAATPSSARAPRRWRCWPRSSNIYQGRA